MATREQYASWIVKNQEKKGTPEFDTVAKAYKASQGQVEKKPAQQPEQFSPVDEMSGVDKFMAGAGSALSNLKDGFVQAGLNLMKMQGGAYSDEFGAVGPPKKIVSEADIDSAMAKTNQEIINTRERDLPLMETGSGLAGNVVGNAAVFAPAAFIPGANTYTGAALVGSAMGALQPVVNEESRMANTVTGAAGGLVGQGIGQQAAKSITSAAAKQSQNAMKDAVLDRSLNTGYVLPKSEVSPSFVSNRLEGVAGKAALKQDATLRNQEVTNSLARKVLGLADDQPISVTAIEKYQYGVSEPYRQVSVLNKKAPQILEKLKETRNEAQSYWKHYNQSADPKSLKSAKRLDAEALKLEDKIEAIAIEKGSPDLLKKLQESRKLLAKSYDIKRALNTTTGDVNAQVLGKLLDKGKPLTDELKTIAYFSKAFPKFSGPGNKVQAPGVSKLEALVGLGLAGSGAGLMGPEGTALGALAFISPAVRSAMLSKTFQKSFVPNNYSPMTLRMLNNPAAQSALRLGAPASISAGQQ